MCETSFINSGVDLFTLQKGGKDTILEDELEFKGIEEEEDEEDGFPDAEKNNTEGDKDKGKDSSPIISDDFRCLNANV